MWSNISAPKSGLKAAQVGQQLLQPKQENAHMGDTIDNHWSPGKQIGASNGSPLMRYKHAVCAAASNGFIYIHGGRFGNGVPLDDDVWRFDPHANAWQQLQTSGYKPPSLQEHSLVEHHGQLYLFGGQVSAASGQENSFWRLDLIRAEWFSLNLKSSMKYGAYLGPANRRGHSACIYRDSMYIFGGYEDFRGSTNQLWQYDLLNERWELRNLSASSACHPEARHSHSAIVHQDSMYIYGGLSNLKPLGDLWRWSWRDKRWFRERTRGKSPGALHGHSAIQAFGSMFVFGGERQSGRTTRSLWRLNLSNLCWQKIKTKGPRPSPTTWHVAIANPMGVLDQANYLIEGGDSSDLEQQQHHHHHHDERLTLLINRHHNHNHQQSASDNCFSQSSSYIVSNGCDRGHNHNHNHHHQQQQQQQTLPMEATTSSTNNFRPHHENPTPNAQRAPIRGVPISHSKSSIEQISKCPTGLKVNNQRDRTKAKRRRLKLGFLKRNRKPPGASCCKSEPQTITTSWSAVDVQKRVQAPVVVVASKRHSSEVLTGGARRERQGMDHWNGNEENSVEMVVDVANTNNAAILDHLDSDIKHMFERAMSPHETTASGTITDRKQQVTTDDATNRSRLLARDSMTQSQLSSWLTGGAGPATSTQTYKTAREQLSVTATSGGLNQQACPVHDAAASSNLLQQPQVAPPTGATNSNRLADVRQRRSMQHFTSQQTRRGRPKSEIVQSLIDRADVIYADHHKTLNFKLEQPHQVHAHAQRALDEPPQADERQLDLARARFNSNDPLLGALANHRMFGRQDAPANSNNNNKRPALDKSNRHTIHQTMTYYNLYFGQLDQPRAQLQRQPASNDLTQSSSVSGSSAATCMGASGTQQLSTSAALIGVRDGTFVESNAGGACGRDAHNSRLESSELSSSLMASSDSRTLCDMRGQGDLEMTPARDLNMMAADERAAHNNNNNNNNNLMAFGMHQRQQHNSSPSDSPTVNDNTSLSFSMIAEFEEDDMLQYSSPTEPRIVNQNERQDEQSGEFDDYYEQEEEEEKEEEEEEEEENDDDHDEPSNRYERHQDHKQRDIKNGHTHNEHSAIPEETKHPLIAQKSTSSGYDSLRSSSCMENNGASSRAKQEHLNQGEYSTSCSLRTNSSPGHNESGAPNNNNQLRMGAHVVTTTAAESLLQTAESNTTTTTSGSSPLSPPSKSLPSSPLEGSCAVSSHKSSFASSLISGPSRLFGKKKTKTRYWQLCMFVLGGKQQSGAGHGNFHEPISIWRLYI